MCHDDNIGSIKTIEKNGGVLEDVVSRPDLDKPGVGQATARLLAHRGYKVFGTSRNPATAESISMVEMLPLDVRTDASVHACVEAVSRRGGRLDVLINNAGFELAGALEELSPQEAEAQFETNFFGVVRMINAVLPSMRQQKRGRIVIVPEVVAEKLLEIISSSSPRLRYLIRQQAKSVARLRRLLPAGMYEQGVRRTFSLDS